MRMDALIITHNGADDLRETLACARMREAFPSIVVVDNDSEDPVAVAMAAAAELVARGRNDSMAVGRNASARLSAERRSRC